MKPEVLSRLNETYRDSVRAHLQLKHRNYLGGLCAITIFSMFYGQSLLLLIIVTQSGVT